MEEREEVSESRYFSVGRLCLISSGDGPNLGGATGMARPIPECVEEAETSSNEVVWASEESSSCSGGIDVIGRMGIECSEVEACEFETEGVEEDGMRWGTGD